MIRKLLPDNFFLRRWYSALKAIIGAFAYGFPAKKITVVGVTGTDGKTTTTEMIFHILKFSGRKVAKISSVSFSRGDNSWQNTTKRTTVSPFVMQKFLRQCVKDGYDSVVIEVSSHALSQKRVFGIDFDIAVLTNISHEHLDYHKSMEGLIKAKKLLFTKYLNKGGTAILNADEPFVSDWKNELETKNIKVKTYSFKNSAYYQGANFQDQENGIKFTLEDKEFFIPIFGYFNAENALAGISACASIGVLKGTTAQALSSFNKVPGRLENIDFGQDFQIFIDFALTPKAFKEVLSYLNQRTGGKLISVFGCAGDHDKEKRPIIGEIASKYADIIILTDDETYTEDPYQIRDEIKAGIFKEKNLNDREDDTFFEIPDRKIAIESALQIAGPNDTVIVSGMGALETRNMRGKEETWNDKAVIANIFQGSIQGKLDLLKKKVDN